MKYRKKPVVIEAIQFSGVGSVYEMVMSWGDAFRKAHGLMPDQIEIDTLEGAHKASKGDWIIKGVKGEFYPCKPDIFEATYEKVEA